MRRMGLGWMLAGLFSLAVGVEAQEMQLDPLLQLLVENKVITMDQAVGVQKEYDRRKAAQQPPVVVPPPAPAPAPAEGVTPEQAKKIAEEAVATAKPNLGDFKGWKLGSTLFLSYQNGEKFSGTSAAADKTDPYSRFLVKRAYLDVRKEITPWLSARVTPDITQDSTGDYKLRLKFAYAQFSWKGNGVFGKPSLLAGIVPTPWDEFDSGVNRYRMQDAMFADRILGAPSADVGLFLTGNFGAEMPKSYQDEVAKAHPGRYGSWSIGVYNGSGYNGTEVNPNKTLQARATFRPLPDVAPGLQFSLGGTWGKGNVAPSFVTAGAFAGYKVYPDWNLYQAMVSYQHSRFALSAQYLKADGNPKGDALYIASDYLAGQVAASDIYKARESAGYSFFGEYRFPATKKLSAFYRHDHFDPDTKDILRLKNNEDVQKRDILGFAWWMYKENCLLFDYDVLRHSRYVAAGRETPDEGRFQITLQLKF